MSTEEYNEQDSHITTIDGLYENWFLDYASYVILERAVPALYDGFKTGAAPYFACHERNG
jgi:topoisomerase-4 subunit A